MHSKERFIAACEHAQRTLDILCKNGGYIFAPSNIYQPDIPLENIVAVYEVA